MDVKSRAALNEKFEQVFLDESSRGTELADRVLSTFSPEKIKWVTEKPLAEKEGALSASDFNRSKRLLYVTRFKGSFFKRCPGSKGAACCNYFVLNLGHQCDMNCSYCYLQSYINTPVLTLYSNLDDAIAELREMAESYKGLNYRVGTGETTDSLSLDELTLFSPKLIAFFRDYPNWTLEFKTKSAKVDQFLDVPHAGNVVCSWSVNAPLITEREEHGTASLNERLAAAEKCLEKGFRLAFHIDPMIWHDGWEAGYDELADRISSRFGPQDVPSITVGALRFQPEQRRMMKERFGMGSLVNQSEVFPSGDGKLRYDSNLRNTMFQRVMKRFKANNPVWNVWLCMETAESWVTTMKASPRMHPDAAPFFRPLPQVPLST